MGASAARPGDRRRGADPAYRFLDHGAHRTGAEAEAGGDLPAGRAAGRGRLVDGVERPQRTHRRQPVPARHAPYACRRDPRLCGLGDPRAGAEPAERRPPPIARRGGIDRRAGRRADIPRRAGRRARRRPDLQYLAADGRLAGAVRAFRPVALVAEPLRERPHGAVRPPPWRLSSLCHCLVPRFSGAAYAPCATGARPGTAGDVAGDARRRDVAGDRAAAAGAAAPARRRDRADRSGNPFPRHVAGYAAGDDGAETGSGATSVPPPRRGPASG